MQFVPKFDPRSLSCSPIPAVAVSAPNLGGRLIRRPRSSERRATSQKLHNPLHSWKHIEFPMADPTPRFGFVAFAETWNGRLAMLGFVIGLGTELFTGQGILSQIGLG